MLDLRNNYLMIKNKALLAKWSWKFVSQKDSLWKRVIMAKYSSEMASRGNTQINLVDTKYFILLPNLE